MPRSSSATPRLRARPLARPLHVVLVEPEIPPNTGNIARLCAATASPLHLVGPLGFRIDEHSVRRAGVDYWHLVDVRQHLDFAHFLHAFARGRPAASSISSAPSPRRATSTPTTRRATRSSSARRASACRRRCSRAYPDRARRHPDARARCARSTSRTRSGIALYEALRADRRARQDVHRSRLSAAHSNAAMPVTSCPRISVWTSCVPSYVRPSRGCTGGA